MTIQWDDVVCATENQVSTSLGDEVAILDLGAGMYYGLNRTGADVWALLQEPVAVSKLHAELAATYEVDAQTVRGDLVALLDALLESGLIEVRHPADR